MRHFTNNGSWFRYVSYLMVLSFIGFTSCKDDLKDSAYKTSDTKMIDEYMEIADNNLSNFLKIVEKADYQGMLHAYGTYTCFVPTNEAVQSYLTERGLTLESLTKTQAEEIVGYHVINDTISTRDFMDGRLPAPNIQKQYLTTRTLVDNGGDVYIEINRTARITVKDVLLGNGYVHVVNKLLNSADKSVWKTIEGLPDAEFSIMKGLVKETGFDKVIDNKESYFTFFLQPNSVFEELSIAKRADLLARLRKNTPDVVADGDLLLNFVQYHCVPDRKYLTDLMSTSALPTYGSKQVLSFSMTKDLLLINEFKVGQLNEEGIPVDRTSNYSDLTCANGVIQQAYGQLEIKKRKAYRVYWDMADQPEIKALKVFRKNSANVAFADGELSEMRWGGKSSPKVTYQCYTSWNNKNQYVYGDYLMFRICTNVLQWCEIKTPLLVEGTYKVWITWRRVNKGTFRSTFKQEGEEDQVLPSVFALDSYLPTYYTDAAKKNLDYDKMEQEGWKQYTAKELNTVHCCRLLGTIKVSATGRHTLRFDALSVSAGTGNNFDIIQFIPVDEDQVWPMVASNGDWIYKGTPGCQIYPDDGSNCVEE